MHIFLIGNTIVVKEGHVTDMWYVSITLYTTIVAVVTLKIIIYTRFWTWMNYCAILFFTIFLYCIWMLIADNIKFFWVYKTIYMLLTSWHFYLTVLVCLWIIYILEMIFIICETRTWADRFKLDPVTYYEPIPEEEEVVIIEEE